VNAVEGRLVLTKYIGGPLDGLVKMEDKDEFQNGHRVGHVIIGQGFYGTRQPIVDNRLPIFMYWEQYT